MGTIHTPARGLAPRRRIAIVSAVLPPVACGEATNTYFTAVKLAERGVDVHVVTTRWSVSTKVAGVTTHADMRRWDWKELQRLLRRLQQIEPDGILLFYMNAMYWHHPMVTYLPSFLRRKLPAATFVARFEHVGGAAKPGDLPWRARLPRLLSVAFARGFVGCRKIAGPLGTLLRDSDAVIALCKAHADRLEAAASGVSDKLSIIPPPPNITVVADSKDSFRYRGRERMDVASTDVVVGFMGYVDPRKGIEDLLASISSVNRRVAGKFRLHLVILGGRIGGKGSAQFLYYDQMQDLARELGVENQVIWSGEFRHDDEREFSENFHAVDFWVLPFRRGGQLNNSSLTSLMANGRAIITTRGETVDDALVDSESVFLVPREDREALCQAIERLAADVGLRERLRARALRFADRELSWTAAIDRTMAALIEDK